MVAAHVVRAWYCWTNCCWWNTIQFDKILRLAPMIGNKWLKTSFVCLRWFCTDSTMVKKAIKLTTHHHFGNMRFFFPTTEQANLRWWSLDSFKFLIWNNHLGSTVCIQISQKQKFRWFLDRSEQKTHTKPYTPKLTNRCLENPPFFFNCLYQDFDEISMGERAVSFRECFLGCPWYLVTGL